ncbi:MAG: hypothetical protein IKG39_10740 [Lachnospiraceae bacterium]|nr:hypothetical protein [Lachnospiraceae bacterium]
MRNIEKQAEQGKAFFNQHPKADLTVKELRYMIDEFTTEGKENLTKAAYNAITKAFYMGVAVGSRNNK